MKESLLKNEEVKEIKDLVFLKQVFYKDYEFIFYVDMNMKRKFKIKIFSIFRISFS